MRINVLEPRIFNKIAAGEVVERPASIVKELVENCIDAKSTKITIEIENGGIDKIRVSDNGCGIDFEDLQKAFLPHATSKIQSEDDLVAIKTLGFRGEALASIGAVSEVSLTSKTSNNETGGIIEISGGTMTTPSVCGADNGTDIVVKNLFFNVPARAKFLKKPKTEESEVTNLVERFILANPCVSIKYIVDGKIKYLSNGTGMVDSIYEIYGKDAVNNTIYLEQDYGFLKIYGYIGKPSFTKPNKTYQTIILNNRYIQNQTIASAVHNAYGDILMKKQFPFYVLYVDLDYTYVDVNVHPNKMEVRFENGGVIYSKVFESINRAINSIDFTKTLNSDSSEDLSIQLPNVEEEVVIDIPQNNKNFATDSPAASIITEKTDDYKPAVSEISGKSNDPQESQRRTIFSAMAINIRDNEFKDGIRIGSKLLNKMQEAYENNENVASNNYVSTQSSTLEQQKFIEDEVVQFNIIGVIFKTYILVEYGQKLLLIDQHAGHERLLFDKFMREVSSSAETLTQSLFIPYILDLNQVEFDFLSDKIKDLAKLGFEIEPFGESSYKVSSVPYMLAEMNLKNFFDDVLHDLKSMKIQTYDNTLRDKLASLACKAAVKAGDTLSSGEIKYLIQEFAKQNTKLLCPHGRPVVVEISKNEIEKWFKRII